MDKILSDMCRSLSSKGAIDNLCRFGNPPAAASCSQHASCPTQYRGRIMISCTLQRTRWIRENNHSAASALEYSSSLRFYGSMWNLLPSRSSPADFIPRLQIQADSLQLVAVRAERSKYRDRWFLNSVKVERLQVRAAWYSLYQDLRYLDNVFHLKK